MSQPSTSTAADAELRTRVLAKDCTECRYTGTAGCAFIASYMVYNSRAPYYLTRPRHQLGLRLAALGIYYLGAARFFYFPPFTRFRDTERE